MAITNGQDQSVEFQREQGRRDLTPKQEVGGSPRLQADMMFLDIQMPKLTREEVLWKLKSIPLKEIPVIPFPDILSHWGMEIGRKPVVERVDYPTGYPVRSRQKLTGLAEGYKNVCERWSLDALGMTKLLHLEEEIGLCDLILSGRVPPMTGDLKDRMALVIGISIGLGELFDDDKDGEFQWLNSTRSALGGASPLEHMLKGDLLNIRDVVDLVDNARGLK